MQNVDEIFKGDALRRVFFAGSLCKLISEIEEGVVAIDGAWGVGKTWFGERVRRSLGNEPKIKTVWLDAFSADWADDPALTLMSEFFEQLPADKRIGYIEKAAPLLGKVAVSASKAGLRALGNFVGLDKESIDEVVSVAQDAEEAYIKNQLGKLAERKRSLEALQGLLSEAVTECGGKVVVFVDELDRCSPHFAIRLLERVKHLFEVKGVVFVLLWNREQIHHAVRSFYGQETDGSMYLDRFVDYSFHLPNFVLTGARGGMGMIVEAEVSELSGAQQMLLHDVSHLLNDLACYLGLSAREVT